MKHRPIEYYRNKLKEEGYKVTPQRVEVIRALIELDHPTAGEIQGEIEKQYPMISPSTVYGALELLEAIGELIPIQEGSETRYDLSPKVHPHYICEDTGEVYDLEQADLKKKLKDLIACGPEGVSRVELNFYGPSEGMKPKEEDC